MTRPAKHALSAVEHYIALVSFSCTEQNYTKVRPTLVISTETLSKKTGKYFLAMSTSAQHALVYGNILASDLKLAGLPSDSIVRPSKMATFEEPSFVKRIGNLSTKGQGKVSAQLHEFIGVVEKG